MGTSDDIPAAEPLGRLLHRLADLLAVPERKPGDHGKTVEESVRRLEGGPPPGDRPKL